MVITGSEMVDTKDPTQCKEAISQEIEEAAATDSEGRPKAEEITDKEGD